MDLELVDGRAVSALEGIGCVIPQHDTQEQSAKGETSRAWSHGSPFCLWGFSGFSVQLLKWCIVVVFFA